MGQLGREVHVARVDTNSVRDTASPESVEFPCIVSAFC